MEISDSLYLIFAFLLITALMLVMMSNSHELVHQQIYRQGCRHSNTSIHYSKLGDFLKKGEFMYTEVEADGCSEDVKLANMLNEVVGYHFIAPISIICGLIVMILLTAQWIKARGDIYGRM